MLAKLYSQIGYISFSKLLFLTAISFTSLVIIAVSYKSYREYSYANAAKRHNCKVPLTFTDRSFGLIPFFALAKAHRNNRLLQYVRTAIEASSRLTYRAEGIFAMNIVTRDPENVKSILATDFKSYNTGYRHDQLYPFLGEGIFTSNGAHWKHSRGMLRPQFSRERISQLQIYASHVSTLLRILKGGSATITDEGIINSDKTQNNEGLLDVQNLFLKLTMDTSSEFLFGQSLETLSPEDKVLTTSTSSIKSSQLINALDIAGKTVSQRVRAGPLYFLFNSKEFRANVNIVHDFVNSVITDILNKENGASDNKKSSFLEELSLETQDPTELRSQALNVLLAGRSTTAGLLSFVIYQLVRNKRVWNKLRETVLEIFGDDPENITYESLKRCSYLQHVLNETLRLCPIVPMNARFAGKDTTLPRGNGELEDQPVFVPKGTLVIYPVFLIHRLKQFWGDDSEEFRPERWDENSFHTWDYIPFNGGPRICIGQQFALSEASYVMVRLLQTFRDVTTTQEVLDREFLQRTNLSTNVYGGVWVKFVE